MNFDQWLGSRSIQQREGTPSRSIIDGLESGRDKGIKMDTHNGFTVFTYQKDRIVFDAFDNIDASLPFVPEFLARFDGEDDLLYHEGTLPEAGPFAKTFVRSVSRRKSKAVGDR